MDNKHGIFICFTGIDGSGKTTQAKNLARVLSINDKNFLYIYARSVPIIFRPLLFVANKLFLQKQSIEQDYKGYSTTKKSVLKRHRILSNMFYQIMLLDYVIQLIYKIKIPLLFNKNIVCDRYIYDTIITDIAVDMGYTEEDVFKLIDKFFLVLPNPDIAFMIDLPEEVALSRKDDVPAIEYLRDRRMYYLKTADKFDMIIIKGDRPANDIEEEIYWRTLSKLGET